MPRRCTTVQGFGRCCQAKQQNLMGQPIRVRTQHGERCAMCSDVTKHNGRPGFQFRFIKSENCGISAGCPMPGGTLAALPAPQLMLR